MSKKVICAKDQRIDIFGGSFNNSVLKTFPVDISNRLTSSPCAVVAQEWGWTGNMEKIMAGMFNPLYYSEFRLVSFNY